MDVRISKHVIIIGSTPQAKSTTHHTVSKLHVNMDACLEVSLIIGSCLVGDLTFSMSDTSWTSSNSISLASCLRWKTKNAVRVVVWMNNLIWNVSVVTISMLFLCSYMALTSDIMYITGENRETAVKMYRNDLQGEIAMLDGGKITKNVKASTEYPVNSVSYIPLAVNQTAYLLRWSWLQSGSFSSFW